MSLAPRAHRPTGAALVSHVRAQHGPSLTASLERLVKPFGGWKELASPGETIAVKVNLLRAAAPETAVCTHPETLRHVLQALKACGSRPFVSDSPGGLNSPAKVARAFRLSGVSQVCLDEHVPVIDVEDDRSVVSAPRGRLFHSFPIGRAFAEADAIIQIGVLKTHQLMRLTGGVKLTYGCIPGLAKAQLHIRASRRDDFADMLLDFHLAVQPRFTLIDAIIAMEGQGPGSGTPKHLESLFAARDCSALDAALADRTNHERRTVHTLRAAERRGLIDLDHPYALAGDEIPVDERFRPAGRDIQDRVPLRWQHAARNLVTARPRLVNRNACIECHECVEICGARAVILAPRPLFNDSRCVRCYACTEVCPTRAIDAVLPLPARLLGSKR